MKRLQRQKGFTLVELAIVLTIIGLLIGGILKGQQLIANAKVTAQMAQVQGIDAAVTTFRDTYAGLPGDLPNALTRVPGCAAASTYCKNGDGNGQVFGTSGTSTWTVTVSGTAAATVTALAPAQENEAFFAELALANLISGSDPSNNATTTAPGSLFPTGKVGGGIWAQTGSDGNLYVEASLNAANPPGTTVGSNVMSPNQAAQIDRKMDDGNPQTGSILGLGYATNCGGTTYTETSASKDCDLLFRIQQ